MSQVSKQLGRTEHIKYTTYWGDGMGRDSYIITGNGGLVGDANMPKTSTWTGYQPTNNTTKMFVNQNHQFRKPSGSKEATAFKYFGDGTGRDAYVVADSGGLIPKYVNKGGMKNFYNSLRQHEKASSSINRRMILNTAQPQTPQPGAPDQDPASGMWYKDSVRSAIRQCYRSQRQQAKRLSNPKTTRSKFYDFSNLSNKQQQLQQSSNRQQTHGNLMMDLEKMGSKGVRRDIKDVAGGRNSLISRDKHQQNNSSLLELAVNQRPVRMSSIGEKPQQLKKLDDINQKVIQSKSKQNKISAQAQSYQRVPAHKGTYTAGASTIANDDNCLILKTEESLVNFNRNGSTDFIETDTQAIQGNNLMSTSQTCQRIQTPNSQSRNGSKSQRPGTTPNMHGKGRMQKSDFKNIQSQIQEYQNKIKQLNAQQNVIDQFNYVEPNEQPMNIRGSYLRENTSPSKLSTEKRNSLILTTQDPLISRSGSTTQQDTQQQYYHRGSVEALRKAANDSRLSATQGGNQQHDFNHGSIISAIDAGRYGDALNNSETNYGLDNETELFNPYGAIQGYKHKKNGAGRGAVSTQRIGTSSLNNNQQLQQMRGAKHGKDGVWQSLEHIQTQLNDGVGAKQTRNVNHSQHYSRGSQGNGRETANSVDKRYNSLERYLQSQSIGSIEEQETNEKIKVQNGRDSSQGRYQRTQQQRSSGKKANAIDSGGLTLERSQQQPARRQNNTKSPAQRKLNTAGGHRSKTGASNNNAPPASANASNKRRNLKELLKLFRDNGFDESGQQISQQGREPSISPNPTASAYKGKQRMTLTLVPKDKGSSPERRKKTGQLIQPNSQNSAVMRRTTNRAFTQMVGGDSVDLASGGNNDFKLDLRDECTATARLEKLKAKYSKQKKAVDELTASKPAHRTSNNTPSVAM